MKNPIDSVYDGLKDTKGLIMDKRVFDNSDTSTKVFLSLGHKLQNFEGSPDTQIIFYDDKGNILADVICYPGSHGYEKGLLEGSGKILMTGNDEREYADVADNLTPEEVIERIKNNIK